MLNKAVCISRVELESPGRVLKYLETSVGYYLYAANRSSVVPYWTFQEKTVEITCDLHFVVPFHPDNCIMACSRLVAEELYREQMAGYF